VKYTGGDLCNKDKNLYFTSQVNYICDPSIDGLGKPELVSIGGNFQLFETQEECHFIF